MVFSVSAEIYNAIISTMIESVRSVAKKVDGEW